MRISVIFIILAVVAIISLGVAFAPVAPAFALETCQGEFYSAENGRGLARFLPEKEGRIDYGYLLDNKIYHSEERYAISYEDLTFLADRIFDKVKDEKTKAKIYAMCISGDEKQVSVTLKADVQIKGKSFLAKLLGLNNNKSLTVYVDYRAALNNGAKVDLDGVRADGVALNEMLIKAVSKQVFGNNEGKENLRKLFETVLNNMGEPVAFDKDGVQFKAYSR